MAQIIKTNGDIIHVEPKNHNDFSLEELRNIVGGYIEILQLQGNKLIVVNEEGKLMGLDYNMVATEKFQETYGYGDYIVGDVLICDKNQIK